VKIADIPAWIARRDKTPMGIYQGGIRSKFKKIFFVVETKSNFLFSFLEILSCLFG
jgi:hypothetical protein